MTERMTYLADGRLLVVDRGPILEVRLHRPETRNALDEELIAALSEVFREISREVREQSRGREGDGERDPEISSDEGPPADIRGIILSAEGNTFCAGADVEYMQRVAAWSEGENIKDARRLSGLFRAIRECPAYVIGRVQGPALGGGSGLVACCDRVIAADSARFGFTEARLGILPAVISPFVIDRIGTAAARALFPTGEIFGAADALRIGLVDRIAPLDLLDESVDAVVENLLAAAPNASRQAKALISKVGAVMPLSLPRDVAPDSDIEGSEEEPEDPIFEETARLIARLRALPEAKEGMAAFLEKRKPIWLP